MEVSMLDAAGSALMMLLDPYRFMILTLGTVLGLIVGILPGIGGIAGMALLLPFTFAMDPIAAFAFLLGLAAVTATSDTIPAVMFGVPGSVASQATVLDGFPMAKKGQAGRALAAAYMASMVGGIAGALLMGLAIPVLRPVVLFVGSPELLALSLLGLSMVAILAGNTPLRGIVAAGIGIMLAMVGPDPQTSTPRWTFDTLYLSGGLYLLPLALGFFALPELCDLAIRRTSVAQNAQQGSTSGRWQGVKDVAANWWLVVRCSWLGTLLGAIPGIGGSVIDWISYGHAMRTEKGARETFGKGDVRGVIAAESAINSKEGGSLIPTIAFGVPGSASMSILLGAFLMHGLIPGPEMLTTNLSITYSMVWTIAIANIIGTGLCFLFSGQLAKIATLRYTLIIPTIICIIFIGAFEASRSWGDLFTLVIFGALGWGMKQLRWPRPPLILGFVLGAIIERYAFISVVRYGTDWLWRPGVMIILGIALFGLLQPLVREILARRKAGKRQSRRFGTPVFKPGDLFSVMLILVVGALVIQSFGWTPAARLLPLWVGSLMIVLTLCGLLYDVFTRSVVTGPAGSDTIYMDLDSGTDDLSQRTVLARAASFFGWLIGFMCSMFLIGLLPTVPIFVIAYMRIEGRERWRLAIIHAAAMVVFIFTVFEVLLNFAWPSTLLGSLVPALRFIPSV